MENPLFLLLSILSVMAPIWPHFYFLIFPSGLNMAALLLPHFSVVAPNGRLDIYHCVTNDAIGGFIRFNFL